MSVIYADRVADTSSTAGLAAFVLDGSEPTNYQSFDAICDDGDTVYYAASHRQLNQWEVGLGTYGADTNILTRTRVLASSNSGSAVNFSAGVKDVIGGHRPAADLGPQACNIRAFGATGNGTKDDTAAIQAAFDSGEPSLYFPAGDYKATEPITLPASITLTGQGRTSRLVGEVDGYIIDRNAGAIDDPFSISGLCVRNTHATGGGIRLNGFLNGSLSKLQVEAYIGIRADSNTFTLKTENCRVTTANGGTPSGSIGIMSGGHQSIVACDIVGFDNAIRACGSTVNVQGCRLEVNKTALMLGQDFAGSSSILSRSYISGNSLEANDTAIYLYDVQSTQLTGFGIQGSAGSPAGGSLYGIRGRALNHVVISAGDANGAFSTAAIKFDQAPVLSSCISILGANSGLGVAWSLPVDLSGLELIQCNN